MSQELIKIINPFGANFNTLAAVQRVFVIVGIATAGLHALLDMVSARPRLAVGEISSSAETPAAFILTTDQPLVDYDPLVPAVTLASPSFLVPSITASFFYDNQTFKTTSYKFFYHGGSVTSANMTINQEPAQ